MHGVCGMKSAIQGSIGHQLVSALKLGLHLQLELD